ncbi:MAG: PolC-type DNA polymerase III, partial [Anaerovoracaceae bacterium]
MLKWLQDMTEVDPLSISLSNKEVLSLFTSTEALGILDEDYPFKHGSFGIPEFGTPFVRGMLDVIQPKSFQDLIRISGFSHGEDVWVGNAKELIRDKVATVEQVISSRDDIMNYLIHMAVDSSEAFKIMEQVRKNKGISSEQEQLLRQNNVPDFYIDSCKKIKYLFPKAHAVAYVIMAFRIAYFKVYHPVEFYAAYLTTKLSAFNWEVTKKGREAIYRRVDELQRETGGSKKAREDEITVLEICIEILARGFEFAAPTLAESKATRFTIKNGKILPPICALNGIGETVGESIVKNNGGKGFSSIEDLQKSAGVNKTAIKSLRDNGLLEGLSESDQFSLF